MFKKLKRMAAQLKVVAAINGTLMEARKGEASCVQRAYYTFRCDVDDVVRLTGDKREEVERMAFEAIGEEKAAQFHDLVSRLSGQGGLFFEIDREFGVNKNS